MKSENELRQRRCCFTGHRPEKLPYSEEETKALLERALRQAVSDGFVTFISGMARGVNIYAAEIVLKLKSEGVPIHLICASPYCGFEKRWGITWQNRYDSIMANADLIRYICKKYTPSCFQIRNEWMVNRSSRLVAIYSGIPGGTKNTIDYANRMGIEVIQR